MAAERKSASPKETSQAIRRRYTWHLRAPFKNQFDSSHWWKGQSKIEPVAALYELARRHPLVSEALLQGTGMYEGEAELFPPPPLDWLWRIGRQSWPKVNKYDQTIWMLSSHGLKGLDFRKKAWNARFMKLMAIQSLLDKRIAVDQPCHCINSLARLNILDQRMAKSEHKAKSFAEQVVLARKDFATNQPTSEEWEAAVSHCAVAAYRKGFVLLAVAPDLAADQAESVMSHNYREHLRLYPPAKPKQRARWEDWLCLISTFEDAEATGQKDTSQIFIRYRRALDGISFAGACPRV
jgi:hypothetical protein